MGAASSIAYGEYVTKEDLQVMYGEAFDEELYEQLKDPASGLVKISSLEQVIEQKKIDIKNQKLLEIQKLFKCYCPNGKMTSRNFIQYLRDAKLFKKSKFIVPDAEIVFNNIKATQETISTTLDCVTFISDGLTILAERLGMDREELITKLSRVEYEHDAKSKRLHEKETGGGNILKTASADAAGAGTATEAATAGGEGPLDTRAAAAIKLQSFSRERVAKKLVNDAREVSNSLFLLPLASLLTSLLVTHLLCSPLLLTTQSSANRSNKSNSLQISLPLLLPAISLYPLINLLRSKRNLLMSLQPTVQKMK
jgi:hypothetical protein